MEIHYKDNEIEKICNDEKYAQRKYQRKIVYSLKVLVQKLNLYHNFNDFYTLNFLRDKYMPEKLKGDKAGITSLRVDYQYRMELKIEVTKSENGDDIITILEVSNHYGD